MPKHKLARISITVPELTVDALDQKIVDQHYESRSQAIVDMINKHLIADQEQRNAVMVGTFTLLYDASVTPLRVQLLDLQQQFLEQVVSSLHIQLDEQKILEVMILQGLITNTRVGGIISQENKLNANKRQLILTLLFTQCCKSLQQLIRK